MTILNVMLGAKRGGLEQAALDYAEALAYAKIPAVSVVAPNAWVQPMLVQAGLAYDRLPHWGYWDPFAQRRLRQLVRHHQARAVLCHGNRAVKLALRALKGQVPVIAVAHNYKNAAFPAADRCLAITEHLAAHLRKLGAAQVEVVPNMVRVPEAQPRPARRTPPVIGSMGRFVQKKGFDVYVRALGLLHARGIAFQALLGGDGTEAETLHVLAQKLGLSERLHFSGWVKDKAAFFDSIDVFVLPSRHEPFGIVLTEALVAQVPVVTSASEGPREIVTHGVDALMVPCDDAEALAEALVQLLEQPDQASSLGQAGRARVLAEYTLPRMAERLQKALAPFIYPS